MNTLVDEVAGAPGNRRLRRAGAYALSGFVAFQLLKSLAPGGNDNPVETLETGFNKAALGAALGFAVGLAGRRGTPGGIGGDFPKLADAMASVPRAGIIQLAQAATSDPTMERVITNSAQLNNSDTNRFDEALRSENPVEGVRDLMSRNDRIRRVLTAPDPRLADVPLKENEDV